MEWCQTDQNGKKSNLGVISLENGQFCTVQLGWMKHKLNKLMIETLILKKIFWWQWSTLSFFIFFTSILTYYLSQNKFKFDLQLG